MVYQRVKNISILEKKHKKQKTRLMQARLFEIW
jgi:hypothetical protein